MRLRNFDRISRSKSSNVPIRSAASWCCPNAGSSSAPLRGSTAAAAWPRIGSASTERRWRSCASPQSASCSENSAIRPEVSGRTLRGKGWSVAMEQRFRRGFTAAEKTELWDRWQRGESLKGIGRAFGKPSSSIYFQVAPQGGIRPAARHRSRLALALSEREEISRGITAHQSARSIAKMLGRSPSTVSREISRNGGYDRYRAALADENAWIRAR